MLVSWRPIRRKGRPGRESTAIPRHVPFQFVISHDGAEISDHLVSYCDRKCIVTLLFNSTTIHLELRYVDGTTPIVDVTSIVRADPATIVIVATLIDSVFVNQLLEYTLVCNGSVASRGSFRVSPCTKTQIIPAPRINTSTMHLEPTDAPTVMFFDDFYTTMPAPPDIWPWLEKWADMDTNAVIEDFYTLNMLLHI